MRLYVSHRAKQGDEADCNIIKPEFTVSGDTTE